MDGPIIRPDAAPHLHQLGRSEPARGRRGHRLHDGRARKRGGQFEEDDIRYNETSQTASSPEPVMHKSKV